jgi:sugar O-acyltransferase (sialic acid O-acetyltransferase NeuD family)
MKKTRKLIIVGLSNNSKLAAFYFTKDSEYEVIGFAVDKEFKTTDVFYELPVYELETLPVNFPPSIFNVFVAIGYSQMNKIRESIYLKMKNIGYTLPNYISSFCTFLSEDEIGDNNLILEDNTIQPFVKIGSNNVIWSGNHIGHDVKIGNHNFITSHVVISGFTTINNNCFLGVNASLRDGIEIADFTLIASGANITNNTDIQDVLLSPRTILHSKKSLEIKISK